MTNSRHLAMRDPALASMVGAIAGATFGSDFGDAFGDEFSGDFGDDISGDFGGDFGDDMGADFGAAMTRAPKPTPSQALDAWKRDHARKAVMQQHVRRARMLDPNKGSPLKIEGYVLSLSEAQVLGTAGTIALSTNSTVTMRPQRLTSNVPIPGVATYASIQVSNVDAVVGQGVVDAYTFFAGGVGVSMSLPTISPADRVNIKGTWTIMVGAGYVAGPFTHTVAFFGPAKMTGS
jgi:hypothetical protein